MKRKTEFLYLSEQDTIQAGVLDAEKCIDNAEEVFRLLSKGDLELSSRRKALFQTCR